MKELMHKIELSEDQVLNIMFTFWIGCELKDHSVDDFKNLINDKTLVTFDICSYTKNGEHGGHYPKEITDLPEGKFQLEELINCLQFLGGDISSSTVQRLVLEDIIEKYPTVSYIEKVKQAL